MAALYNCPVDKVAGCGMIWWRCKEMARGFRLSECGHTTIAGSLNSYYAAARWH